MLYSKIASVDNDAGLLYSPELLAGIYIPFPSSPFARYSFVKHVKSPISLVELSCLDD